MKHLKLFENTDEPYTFIGNNYNPKVLENQTPLDKKIFDLHLIFFNAVDLTNKVTYKDRQRFISMSLSHIKIFTHIRDCYQGVDIFSINDEWYIVNTTFGWWKCDQWDGVWSFPLSFCRS